jgi:hypothetical protein
MDSSTADLSGAVQDFTSRCRDLGRRLTELGGDLEQLTRLPPEDLDAQLSRLRQEFVALRQRAVHLATQEGLPSVPRPDELTVPAALVSLYQQIADAWASRTRQRQLRESGLAILDRVLSLAARDGSALPPLAAGGTTAAAMREAVLKAIDVAAVPGLVDLVEATHPFRDLLTLVEQFDHLDDERWDELEQRLRQSLAPAWARAAVRGRLLLPSQPSPAPEKKSVSVSKTPLTRDGAVLPRLPAALDRPIPNLPTRVGGAQVPPSSRPPAAPTPRVEIAPAPATPARVEAPAPAVPVRTVPVVEETPARPATAGNGQAATVPVAPLPPPTAAPPSSTEGRQAGRAPEPPPPPPPPPPPVLVAPPFGLGLDDDGKIKISGAAAVAHRTTLAELPAEIRRFEVFHEQFWISPAGLCQTPPWQRPDFRALLPEAMTAEAHIGRPARLWLFARAAERLGLEPIFATRDLEAMAALQTAPLARQAGRDEQRGRLFDEVAASGDIQATPRWRLTLFLEAVRPSGETPPREEDLEGLVELAGFQSVPLRKLVLGLLLLATRGFEPLEQLRDCLLSPGAESPAALAQRLEEERNGFHQLYRELYSAAGGRIERTHCREAWTLFVREAQAVFHPLFPADPTWDVADMENRLGRLTRRCRKLFDDRDVKFGDRKKMDRAADRLLHGATAVNEALRRLQVTRSARGELLDLVPVAEARALLDGPPLEAPEEELCRRMLGTLLAGSTASAENPLDVTLGDLCRHPELLGVLPGVAAAAIEPDSEEGLRLCQVADLTDTLRASSALLQPPPAAAIDSSVPPAERLVRHLDDRPELLAKLSAVLKPARRSTVQHRLDEIRAEIHLLLGQLDAVWRALQQLASPVFDVFRQAYETGCRLADDPGTGELKLLAEWLRRALDHARRAGVGEVLALLTRAETLEEEEREGLVAAVHAGRYAEALLQLGEEASAPETARRRRETPWRKLAPAQFSNPAQLIANASEANRELREAWLRGITGSIGSADRNLRSEFAKFICSVPSRRGKGRSRDDTLYQPAHNHPDAYRLPCAVIREWVTGQGLNPCYLPQLLRFTELVILTPPVKLSDAAFRQRTAELVAKQGPNTLCAVLTPNLRELPRQELLRLFRDRKLTAAVLDDLDLCRLLNPGGEQANVLLGLFEIILEQQRWDTMSPFVPVLGQNVQREMYVGRGDEADRLSRSPDYSRLFSGRKLGKSALLKFIQETRDGQKLPSGNTLRVLLVPAVGPDARELVHKIKSQLQERLNYSVPGIDVQADPGDALVALANAFVKDRTEDSLLVILDEADVFVEAELEHYQTKHEQCLSFRIRNEVESHLDANDLPRIRFVFSGYRVTNTSDGAWAHWREVLHLKPLDPADADDLVAGPLARLGIDLAEQTRVVSWMCGYQPAVLLKFGQELLRYLNDKYPPTQREHVVVTAEDVALVFNRDGVREEIRTVVRNNFQDNRRGLLVFLALLLEFAELPPGEGIDDVPGRILERLRGIEPDLSWLERQEGSALGEVAHRLRDLVARQLLVERRGPAGSVYHLRFPHHLPILCPPDQDGDQKLREEILAYRSGGERPSGEGSVRALLGPKAMDDLRYVVKTPFGDDPARAAVVASLWPTAVNHRSCGLPVLLGIDPSSVLGTPYSVLGTADAERLLAAPRLAVLDASPADLQAVLARRSQELARPLVTGGADLLRCVLRAEEEVVGDSSYLLYTLGRLGRATVEWWFSRVRRLGLPGPSAAEEVMRLTAGMPLLLRIFDQVLAPDGQDTLAEEEVTPDQFRAAVEEYHRRLPEAVRGLRDGGPALCLEARERELLRMTVAVCRAEDFACSAADLRIALTEGWSDLYQADCPLPPVTEADHVALLVVQLLGLVPCDPDQPLAAPVERLVPLKADDPLLTLTDLLEGQE